MSAALRMVAHGTGADAQNENCSVSKSTVMETFYTSCRAVGQTYADEYLRTPTEGDTARILALNERRGMPGPSMITRLYSLAMKELPDSLAWALLRQVGCSNGDS
jgi:hypothetical protein